MHSEDRVFPLAFRVLKLLGMSARRSRAFRICRGLLLAASLAFARNAEAAGKLWLAWDASTASCKQNTIDFFNCILDDTNFNALALQYRYGEGLTLAGSATLSQSCAPSDFQCVVNATGFRPTAYDVVMHFYGSGWGGGTNGTQTVNVNGSSVLINTAWVQSGDNCNGQTCTGAHEAYEAATDGVSADCCNGQYGHPSCPQCQPSCAQFDGNNGNPPWGCYPFTCPNGVTYSMELLGAASNEFSAAGCTKLTLASTCGAPHAACTPETDGGNPCCSGLSCEYFSLSGQPPYARACCLGIGSSCSVNTDCCGGSNCAGGKCACVPEGQWCINADECCAGSTCDLTAHSCVASPPPDAGSREAGSSDAGSSRDGAAPQDAAASADGAHAPPPSNDAEPNAPEGSADSPPGGGQGGCSCITAGGRGGGGLGGGELVLLGLALAARTTRRLGARRGKRAQW